MLVWKKKEQQLLTVKPPGQLLGVLPEVTCTVAGIALAPGDRILLHTDGLTECPDPDGEPFGEQRVAAALQDSAALSVGQLSESLYAALTAWSGDQPHFEDDVALIIMEME
jgi:sigma-B regulation protein RsbU (phosphoserine phosphatase)